MTIPPPVPPSWRALGYAPFAELVATLQIDSEHPPMVRKRAPHLLPPPDAVILTGTSRTPLPGWCHETITTWLRENHPARWPTLRCDWIEPPVAVDPRIEALAADVFAETGRLSGTSSPTLGYDAAAAYVSSLGLRNEKGKPISMSAAYLRLVWRYDLTRGYHAVAPIPDAIISRGPKHLKIPGWTEQTLSEWPGGRQTPGNWSFGDQRAKRKTDSPTQRESPDGTT